MLTLSVRSCQDGRLRDVDGSESVVNAVLTGGLNGMLVYAGRDINDALSENKALNTGDDGAGSNTN